ncbi:MAG: hypothetical protein JXB85_06005 [Anaerolineales bacterium]|nr:hypothetical protein [Anaerolineales bacterium]
MDCIRILNLEPENYSGEALALLQSLGEVDAGPHGRAALLELVGRYQVLIVRLAHQIDREVLGRATRLRVLVSATTGLDHIDVAAAEALGVTILSLRGETEFLRNIPATAEHTWGLLLALVRNLPAAHASVLAGEWQRDRFRGHDLAGQTLGLLGLGRIGEKVARYGLAFGMRVTAFDPYRTGWPEGVERLSRQSELLQQSRILSIHVPLNAETEGLVGAAELALLPPGAWLINTARGQVLDEQALLAALEGRHLAGAALDVLSDERGGALAESALVRYACEHANLILTPHIGGATGESMAATEVFMAHKLSAFLTQLG